MSAALRRAIAQAFEALDAQGWITQIEPDLTGEVCRAFDSRPDAPGFVALCYPVPGDHALIEVGVGVGDEEADLEAAQVVATALRNAGLTATTELREGAAYVTVCMTRGGAA